MASTTSSYAALLKFIRPGDWLVLLTGGLLCAALWPLIVSGSDARKAQIRVDGEIVAELALDRTRRLEVPGPLGITTIEVQPGRARVAADPGPRQYCVRQGWLTRANAVAICAPNHVSLILLGRSRGYDSLNY